MKFGKLGIVALLLIALVMFQLLELGQYLSLDWIKANQLRLAELTQAAPLQSAALYFALYVLVTGLSLPGAAILTLAGGALFGLGWGLLLISFASTLGATLAFLLSRYVLRDSVQRRFPGQLAAVNRGIAGEGAFYLFTLRLVPLFPFFVINLIMGVTAMRVWTFAWVSQVGMLAGTLVYVNAGTQLAQIDSLSGILSPSLLASFVALGLFPLLAKHAVTALRQRQLYAGVTRPQHFDTDLVVIGAGSAGLVSAYIGAAVKAKVSLIEKHRMGGDCLNTGCVPSKALIRSSRFIAEAQRCKDFGIDRAALQVDFARVMERVQRVVRQVEPHDSIERYTGLGVDCIQGEARILSPYQVRVNGTTLRTRHIVIATGARPALPPIPGIEDMQPLTSDTIWDLRTRPQRLLVLGGGPIGCELAQCFARLGCAVTLVLRGDRLLPKEDVEVADLVRRRFVAEGIDLRLHHQMQRFRLMGDSKQLLCDVHGDPVVIEFDQLLVATGRQANVSGFGLEALDIPLTPQGTIEVNDYLQTRYPNIYACGDVAGPYQFTHAAAHQAWYAVVNALFGRWWRFKVDYRVIPAATFTEPEVARVGLNEQQARAQGIACEVTRFELAELDRAIADEATEGFVKVLTEPGRDRILGVTIVGAQAGDLIAEYVLAMRHGLGLNKILQTIHIYPTLAEANKYAAGAWKRAHLPERLLRWVEAYHQRQRGG